MEATSSEASMDATPTGIHGSFRGSFRKLPWKQLPRASTSQHTIPYNTYQHQVRCTSYKMHTHGVHTSCTYKKTRGDENMPAGGGVSVPCPYVNAFGPKGKVKQGTPQNKPGGEYFRTYVGTPSFPDIPRPPSTELSNLSPSGRLWTPPAC